MINFDLLPRFAKKVKEYSKKFRGIKND